MNRILSCLFILFCAEIVAAQHTYKAEYYSKSTPNLAIQITYDSSSDDDDKDTTGFADIIRNAIGTVIQSKIVLSGNTKGCDIEVIPIETAQMNGVTHIGAKYKWNGNQLLIYKSDSGKFVPANKRTIHVKYTGAEKKILEYDCKEAKSQVENGIEVTVWVCEKLPSFINPAVVIEGARGAVLEYTEKNLRQISITKLEVL